jgi:hypothetical protein
LLRLESNLEKRISAMSLSTPQVVYGRPWSKQTPRSLGAATTTLPTCNLAMPEDPEKVAAVIDQAAKRVPSK